ncbi:MAG: M12 family metallo-peptidase, partial [Planctomycetota bacterium]|nr:M12 family metallo-peptidase [Planctomycetota bacterium]
AGGISGIPRGGDIDPFSALVVIHELGHQFGANHTFSGTRGRCLGNVSTSTAWEAGSGSSPMAYAGGCPVGDAPPTDNITQFADPFFHHGSLGEMQAFLANGGGASCATITATANSIPVITSVTSSVAIPPGTPFVLSASASDADSDALAYSWEQFDNGVARPLSGAGATDDGSGALFRIFPPVAQSQRVFPRMSDVLSGIPTPGERLPTVTGATRKFRVVVRDFAPGAGATATSSFVNLAIAPGTTPFTVTVPAAASVYQPGPLTVQWTVGGTNLPPVSVAAVSIDLSLDNGLTFSQPLGVAPNSGSATLQLPAIESGLARIRVSAVGAPFFAVSRPFVIQFPCAADVNGDGGVDGSDVQAFFEVWESGEPVADFNADGGVDGADVETFFRRWEAGC